MDNLWGNFESVMLNHGFVGILNSVQAEKLLESVKQYMKRNSIVVRYSRQNPEVFSVSAINIVTGHIWHVRNGGRTNGIVMPVPEMIQKFASRGYALADFYMDENSTVTHAFRWASRSEYGIRSPYGCFDRIEDKLL
jgi:hypothetical protein